MTSESGEMTNESAREDVDHYIEIRGGKRNPGKAWERALALGFVRTSSGCFEFQGCINASGYGLVSGGWKGASNYLTHRLCWEVHNGPIPKGMLVRHHCDNPACAEITHLALGTQADNMMDAQLRNRVYKGGPPRKDNCIRGHPLSGDNLIERPRSPPRTGSIRRCKACEIFHNRNRK